MLTFDENKLRERLLKLSPKARAVFAACCATRLRPAYAVFCERSKSGDLAVLESALAFVWSNVDQLGNIDTPTLDQQLKHVMVLIPRDDDESWTELHKFAEDSLASTAYALRIYLRGNADEAAKEAAWAARRVFEAISSYVVDARSVDVSRKGFAELVDREPMMQNELTRQGRDLEELGKPETLERSDWIARFRVRAEAEPALLLAE